MVLDTVFRLLSPKQVVTLLMIGLDGQVISGYGMSVTLHFPKDKRKEILEEVF